MQWENIKSAVKWSKARFLKFECLSMSQILLETKTLKTFMLFVLLKVFLSETKYSSLTNTYQLQGTML